MTVVPDQNAVCCLRCGYDLRVVGNDGTCPECGLSKSASIGLREKLEECPPGWVRRVAIGTGALAVSAVLLAIPAAEGMLLNLPLIRSPWGYGGTMALRNIAANSFWDFLRMGGWVLLLFGIGLPLQGLGVWLVTGREPGKTQTQRTRAVAWRVLTLLAIAGYEFDLFFGPSPMMWMWSGRDWWLSSGAVLARFAYVACPAIGLWYVRWLTVRMGRPKLAEYAAIVGAGLSAVLLNSFALNLLAMLEMANYYYSQFQTQRIDFAEVEAVVVAAMLVIIAGVYAIRRILGRRPSTAGYVYTTIIFVLAIVSAEMIENRNYTRHLWQTALAIGLPMAAAITFYLWAVLVLARTAWTLWGASRKAEAAWVQADASRNTPSLG